MSDLRDRLDELNHTNDYTDEMDPEDAQKNQMMGVLAYISWLVVIPLICAKDSRFARFHANQGLILTIAETVLGFLLRTCGRLPLVGWVFGFAALLVGFLGFLLTVLGIANAIYHRAKELPVIGKYRILK